MTDKNQEDIDKTKNQGQESEENPKPDKTPPKEEQPAVVKPEAAEGEAPKAQQVEFAEEDIDTIGEIGNIFMGSASTTLSTLLKHKVQITTPEVEVVEGIDNSFITEEDVVIVEINYTQGLDGKILLALKNEDAAVIADIMAGGAGQPDDGKLDDVKISTIGEVMNQMVGTASTALSTMLNMQIAISPPVVRLSEKTKESEKNPELAGQKVVSVKFSFKIGNLVNSELVQFMSVSAAKAQVNGIKEVMKDMNESLADNSSQSIVDELIQEHKDLIEDDWEKIPPSSGGQQSSHTDPFAGQQSSQNFQNQVTVQPVQFASFDNVQNAVGTANQNLNLVMDVNLGLTVELGKAELPIKNVLELTRGSIIELDKVAGEPVELYANGKLIAKGEVVVIEDNFGLRITSIVSPEQRIKHL